MALDPSYVAPPPAEPVPGVLLYGRAAPGLAGEHRAHPRRSRWRARDGALGASRSSRRSDYEGRRYGLTTEHLRPLPLDRTRVIEPSAFSGIALDDEVTLPVAFVKIHHATRFVIGPGGPLRSGDPLGFRQAVPITGEERRVGGDAYLVATVTGACCAPSRP